MADKQEHQDVALIPREVLFGNPAMAAPQISPDGTRMAYLAPVDGVLNVWVGHVGQNNQKPITHDTDRGVRVYFWAHDGRQILYLQDVGGDENWRLFSVDLETGEAATIPNHVSPDVPELLSATAMTMDVGGRRALVADAERMALFSVDLETGERKLVTGAGLGAGPELAGPIAMVLEPDAYRVHAITEAGLVAVNLLTGERTLTSGEGRGEGPSLGRVTSIALDAYGRLAYLFSADLAAVSVVELGSGDRVLLSR